MFDAQYERLKILGQGSYGAAYLVRERNCPSVIRVAKEIPISHLTAKEREATLAEAGVLSMMSHSNIVAYVATFCEGPKLHIVMEYADGGDLAKKIMERKEKHRTFSEREIMFILVQLALALQHIHARNILHRDLKPLNIFLTQLGVVKLGDFGIAKVLGSTSAAAQTVIGTPHYLSPEICNNEPYGIKSDLWSLGVVLYELAALKVPFHAHSLPVIAMKICSADPEPLSNEFSTDLQKLVLDLLKKEPAERLSLDGMLRCAFVQGHIRALLLHSFQRNSGGCENMVSGSSAVPLKETNKPLDDVNVGAGMVDCSSTPKAAPQKLEVQSHVDAAAKEAVRQEFFRNRRAALETKQRAEGVADVLNTQKENRSMSPALNESSGQQVAEVRRRSEEERRQREQIRWSELERARQEMRQDVAKLQQIRRSRESNHLFSGNADPTMSPELNPTSKKICVRCDENSPVTDKENLSSPMFARELSEMDKARQELIRRNNDCFSPPWRMPRAPQSQEEAGETPSIAVDVFARKAQHLNPLQQMQNCSLNARDAETPSADVQTLHGYVADNEFTKSNTHYESMPSMAQSMLVDSGMHADAEHLAEVDRLEKKRLAEGANRSQNQCQGDTKFVADPPQQLDESAAPIKGVELNGSFLAVKSTLSGTFFSDTDVLQLQEVLKTALSGAALSGDAGEGSTLTGDVGAATLEYSTISTAEELEPPAAFESSEPRLDTTLKLPCLPEAGAGSLDSETGARTLDSADNGLLNTNGSSFLTPDCTGQLLCTTKLIEESCLADLDSRLPVFESAPVDLTNQPASADGQEAETSCLNSGEGQQSSARVQSPAEVQPPIVQSEVHLSAPADPAVSEVEDHQHAAAEPEQRQQEEPESCKKKRCCALM